MFQNTCCTTLLSICMMYLVLHEVSGNNFLMAEIRRVVELSRILLIVLAFMQNSLSTIFTAEEFPNIVLIAVNQFGLEDLSLYNGEHIQHIKKLAEQGITFSHVYSQLYPTSSRAALLTGRLPVKSGMLKGRFLPFTSLPSVACSGGMPLSEVTIAEALQRKGYESKFVGLWDLGFGKNGKFTPVNQGFQSWYGILTQHSKGCSVLPRGLTKDFFEDVMLFLCFFVTFIFGVVSLWYFRYLTEPKFILYGFVVVSIMYVTSQGFHGVTFITVRSCVLFRDEHILAQPYDVENLTPRFTKEAREFIEKEASTQTPFFLMVNHPVFSKPFFNSRIFNNISGKSDKFLDSLAELDWSVGRILETLKKENLTDNTMVIFTALSGSSHKNLFVGLGEDESTHHEESANGKGEPDNWESQIKVPLYIKWPKKWKGGWTINITVTLLDVMPTILELMNQSFSDEIIDGKSLLPLLSNSSDSLHKFVFHYIDVTCPSAVTYGKYKAFYYTKTGDGSNVNHDPPLLYDIMKDPTEMFPLPVDEYQEVISNLTEAVEKHHENRTRKWISQFEHPILLWLFPCANFPYCYRTDSFRIDSIFDSSELDLMDSK